MRVAIVTKTEYNNVLTDYIDFDFDYFYLTDSKEKKILKKDITLDFTLLDEYDYVILIGAEACKFIGGVSSVVKYQGTLVDDKWLPLTNPRMLKFNPAGAGAFEKAIKRIENVIDGNDVVETEIQTILIQSESEIDELLGTLERLKPKHIALDTETTALYERDGYVLGISLTYVDNIGYYIDADYITDDHVDRLQKIIRDTIIIFHNAKFDMHMLQFHFGLEFPKIEDTMLLHYCLNEVTGTHGLKDLVLKYTDMGDYDKDLDTFKRDYCKRTGTKLGDFTYDLIPFDILGIYAAKDTVATFKLFILFKAKVESSPVSKVYNELLIPGTRTLLMIENNGVPFSKEQLLIEQSGLVDRLAELQDQLYTFDVIHEFEKLTGKIFNTNSVIHKRQVLFTMLGLKGIGKKTDKGELSTDAEVMEDLATQHDLPKLIGEISKLKKIKSTYIDKILISLDSDSRLRTFFNLHTTTSGRLSSSGKLNMQQLPRDNKAPKRCITARPGYNIVSGDLGTAEMYVVAVLSGDKVLQQIFVNGEDYHSMIAKYKFDLPYTDKEIKENFSHYRQEAKTVSFEILYKLNFNEEVLKKFKTLKKWLHTQKDQIEEHGFIYQFFGRKRRMPNVFSSDRQVRAHEVRSGVNALVQGPSSDINLFACIDLVNYIQDKNMKTKVFAMVHDSILAEVPDDELEHYCVKLKEFMQKDRGLSIPGTPIKVDIEIGSTYALEGNKVVKPYGNHYIKENNED